MLDKPEKTRQLLTALRRQSSGKSAFAISGALHEFSNVLEAHTLAFNAWAASQEEIAARLAAVERRLQTANSKRVRPAKRQRPQLELVKS